MNTIEEKLDAILLVCQENLSNPEDARRKLQNICLQICGNIEWHRTPLFQQYVGHLSDGNFIESLTDNYGNLRYYVATIKGLSFEGFLNERQRKEADANRLRNIERQNEDLIVQQNKLELENLAIQRGIRRLTIALVLVSVPAAIWYIIELVKITYSLSHQSGL